MQIFLKKLAAEAGAAVKYNLKRYEGGPRIFHILSRHHIFVKHIISGLPSRSFQIRCALASRAVRERMRAARDRHARPTPVRSRSAGIRQAGRR